jgi:uncharacterized protein YkwD
MFESRYVPAQAGRRMSVTLAALMLAWGGAGAATASAAAHAPGPCADAAVSPSNPAMQLAAANAIVCLINVERAQRGLPPVAPSLLLGRAANGHAIDMVRRHYFDHVSPTGLDLRKRVARTGYLRGARRAMLGETLAFGSATYGTPVELVKDLMGSAEHRAIITDRRFRDIGVGLAVGEPMEGMGSGSTLSLDFGRR